MLDWFEYHGHMCIAFEMLGQSVFDFLVSNPMFKDGSFSIHEVSLLNPGCASTSYVPRLAREYEQT